MLPVTLESFRLFLHVLAATIWVGGQLTLAALVPVLRRAGVDVPQMAARRFGRLAWAAFVVLIGTGIWNIVDYPDKAAPGYHTTIAIKLVFVALSGIGAYVHQRGGSRAALAVGGAVTGLFALGALFLGIVLAE